MGRIGKHFKFSDADVVGIIPAGGEAARIAPIPCSKEILPISVSKRTGKGSGRINVVSTHLLEGMKKAEITKIFFVIRENKWDIPGYYGDGADLGINIAYLVVGSSPGTPFTVNQAYPFINDKIVALGFPDILFSPDNAFSAVKERLNNSKADIVLGLFKTDRPDKMDMVKYDKKGIVTEIIIKPEKSSLLYAWVIAMWKPKFTSFMNQFMKNKISMEEAGKGGIISTKELYMGDLFLAALKQGMIIDTARFKKGSTIDIGTTDDLVRVSGYLQSII